jgi:hypothetical protein
MFHGIGAPHTSLANTAVSTPDMNREARWIPRGNSRTFTDIQTHNDGNNRQNDTSMNAPTSSRSVWP